MNKEFKYKAEFTAFAHVPITDETNKFFSKASLDDLKQIIPGEIINSYSLLGIALPSFTANLGNLNQDIILGEEALATYKKFVHQPVNRGHIQAIPIGHVVHAALTNYNSEYKLGMGHEILTEDDIKKNINQIFNVSLAAALYWVVDEDFLKEVEDSSNSESDNYMDISASLEVQFNEYQVMRGSNDISKAEFIDNEDEKEALKPMLKVFGGKGVDKDGNKLWRVMKGEIEPVGLGLIRRNRKAGTVQGLVTASLEEISKNKNKSVNSVVSTDKISKIEIKSVKEYSMKNIKSVDELKKLKQEDLPEVAVASVIDVITDMEQGIVDADKKYKKQLTEKDEAIKEAKDTAKAAEDKSLEVEKELNKVKEQLQSTEQKAQAAEKEQKFQSRMSSINETYTLNDKQSAAIAKDIKDLDEDAFKEWLEHFELFAAKKPADDPEDKNDKGADEYKEDKDGNIVDSNGKPAKGKFKKVNGKFVKAEEVDDKSAEEILEEAKAKKEQEIVAARQIEDDKYGKDFQLGEGIILTK